MIAYVVKCSHSKHSTTFVYSADAKSVNNFEILNHEGEILLQTSKSSSSNVTITVTRRVGYEKYFGDFEGIFTHDKSSVRYEEKITKENFWHWLGSCKYSSIVVDMPQHLANSAKIYVSQDIGKIAINNIGGDSVTSVFLYTKFGDVILNGIEAEAINGRTHGGDIKLKELSGSHMVFSTDSGDIKLLGQKITMKKPAEGRSNLDICSIYGDIDLRGIQYADQTDVNIALTVGKISLKALKFGGHFHLNVKDGNAVVTGDVHYDKNTRNEKEGSFGKGNSTLTAHNTRGDIDVSFD